MAVVDLVIAWGITDQGQVARSVPIWFEEFRIVSYTY